MGSVIILSGPIGAGKTTIARHLRRELPGQIAYIEGDRFWSFVDHPPGKERREAFRIIMRSMTAAAVPFTKSGYDVLLDFSIPPEFLKTARVILKETPLHFVVVRPSKTTCAARAASRPEGGIADYSAYDDFYELFCNEAWVAIDNQELPAEAAARQIAQRIGTGEFLVP